MTPLAERMRPQNLDDYIGQNHLVGETAILRKAILRGNVPSMILWGPPGVGKTTLAQIMSNQLSRPFFTLSAINAGVKDVRDAIDSAKSQRFFNTPQPILFIDEIHRFNKTQLDALLGAVEKGVVTLVGATTENPSFELTPALLSRCQVYVLKPLEKDDLINLVDNVIKKDEYLSLLDIQIKEYDAMIQLSGGDARKLLNILEIVVQNQFEPTKVIDNETVSKIIQENILIYDKGGEQHYDIVSAFIKSMRGSDPNAAVYWLARMLDGGEDIEFIARRMLILSAEDIGLANPNALLMANTCFEAIQKIGMPEARIILSQCAIYLATSPKSNSAYTAIEKALGNIKKTGTLPVPLHLRNAPTQLMKSLNYGKNYLYAHDYEGNFAEQDFLPDQIENTVFYEPAKNPAEESVRTRLKNWWKKRYGY